MDAERFSPPCLPHAEKWDRQILPTLKQDPKHRRWEQKGMFPVLQHQEVGHGKERLYAVVLPAPGFQLWPLDCKASAK